MIPEPLTRYLWRIAGKAVLLAVALILIWLGRACK